MSFICHNSLCSTMSGPGFPKLWSGARANVGLRVLTGKFLYEVRVERHLDVTHEDAGAATADTVHLCRVGWSTRRAATHALGEDTEGWGFGGTARKSHAGSFEAYGERYGVGDVISCAIDLETGAASFAKNGQPLGVAFTIDPAAIERGLFPHILLKNVEVHVSFAARLSSSFPDYEPMQSAVALGACTARVPPPPRPSLVMLVGLPATGKSTWAELHMKQHPEKRYTLLSTDNILEQMKVAGLTRQRNYSERWEQLMPEASNVLNKLISVAASRKRNFLWDQVACI